MKTITLVLLLGLGMIVGCGGDGAKTGSTKTGSATAAHSAAPAGSATPASTGAKK